MILSGLKEDVMNEVQKKCTREYREKNRKLLAEKARKYYYENKECVLGKRAEYREKNKEKISLKEAQKRLSDPDRFEKNKAKHFEWSSQNRERINSYQRRWYQENKEKRRAHVVLNRAVKAGSLTRPNRCSECYKICKPDGHHVDYSKPLNVIWICRACHSRKSPRTVIR